ncbi:hypothetical protein [Algoriphagus confluentis]|uniref:T9SS type A sorting domain-containing protein n=1 Tax=Algoriphagus confluentis TaxID=1697556 RepID=A0ABQ6PKR4_9BACT|nr:hypothetical protein Aconfl_08740 [Algoriphagus confluentis]
MKFFLICCLWIFSLQAAIAVLPSRVNIDGTWYTNGQTAYIKCDKTNVNVYIDLVVIPGPSFLKISVSPSSNFTVSSTQSDIMKTLNLDPSRQNGWIDVAHVGISGNIRVYIQQKPPTPSISVETNICAGSSRSITATSNYDFQSTHPIQLVWQTYGGVTVNGGSSFTQNGTSSTVTIANVSNGSYSVKAVIPSCGNLESAVVNVKLGPPVITNPNYWLFDPGSNMWQFSQTSGGPGVTYTFYISSGSAILNPQNQDCYITTSSGATICVTGTNSCGTGIPYCFYLPPAGGYLKTVYPNPATNLLSIEFEGDMSSEIVSFDLILYSEKSMEPVKRLVYENPVAMDSFGTNQKLEIDVKNFPRGVYYLHLIPNPNSKLPVQKVRVVLE